MESFAYFFSRKSSHTEVNIILVKKWVPSCFSDIGGETLEGHGLEEKHKTPVHSVLRFKDPRALNNTFQQAPRVETQMVPASTSDGTLAPV